MNIFEYLVDFYNKKVIELHLYYNGVDYDMDFVYNAKNDILTASSSVSKENSFGGDGITIAQHIKCRNIEIKFKYI